jgi:hypothetical protein
VVCSFIVGVVMYVWERGEMLQHGVRYVIVTHFGLRKDVKHLLPTVDAVCGLLIKYLTFGRGKYIYTPGGLQPQSPSKRIAL